MNEFVNGFNDYFGLYSLEHPAKYLFGVITASFVVFCITTLIRGVIKFLKGDFNA
ncbi:MAG: hypothetical protein VKL60_15055 [Sphaerospermopsis sp.]|nr:hypothetical protein [Sphaerospermopsis sp.]